MTTVKYTLDDFVHEMEDLLSTQPGNEKIFDRGSDYLSRLIANPDAIPERYRQPVGSGRRANHGSWLLHHSPDSGLLVTAVVWGPGDHAAPHDHRTWGMIGVMDNALTETRFRRVDDRQRDDWARLERDRSAVVKPGEISLAHRGVLFLDEINEHPTKVLEVLRQPIEDKVVTVSRAKGSITFPANFLLVAARNPCPCGFFGDPHHTCSCTPNQIKRYEAKLSGPLLDRIDMHIDVPRVDYEKLMADPRGERSADIRQRVENARRIQSRRFKGRQGLFANADMTVSDIDAFCALSRAARQILRAAVKKYHLSARGYHRTLKLSRTIADLDSSRLIEVPHVSEALQFRGIVHH